MFVTIKNTDIEQFFNYPKKHLMFAGCWPVNPDSKWTKCYHLYAIFFTYPMAILMSLSILIHLFFSLDTIETATDAVYVLANNFSFVLKFISFLLKSDKFKTLLKSMENPLFLTYKEKHDGIVDNWKNSALSYNKWFFNSVYVCVGFFAVFPILDQTGNVLPLGGWIPFDIQNSTRNYVFAYIFQLIGLLFTAALSISIDLLPSVFMNIGCSQVEILKDHLKNAVINSEERVQFRRHELFIEVEKKNYFMYEPLSEDVEKELHKILKHCVRHHDAINRLFRDIEDVFNPGMLFLFIADGIAICVTFLQLLIVPIKSFKYITVIQYLIAITIQISLYCWNGHHVIVQSTTIGDSCYEMEWFRCSTKMKKEIRIIMERCKRPVKLSAGGIFELSITTLTQILRTSYQYFNVLRSVYTK